MSAAPDDVAAIINRLVYRIRSRNTGRFIDPTDCETLGYYGGAAVAMDQEIIKVLESQAAQIAQLTAERDGACNYLETLLVSYVNKYCSPIPEWKPLTGDLIGMLTQVDNASTVTGELKARALKAEADLARALEVVREHCRARDEVEKQLRDLRRPDVDQLTINRFNHAEAAIRDFLTTMEKPDGR